MSDEAIESVDTSEAVEVSEAVESNENETVELQSQENEDGEASEAVEVKAETEQELEEEIKEAVQEGASEEDVKDMIREFTLKVNGKEIIKEVNLNDEDSIKKELQMAYAGRQAMQESAELKKLYKQEIDRLKDDPFAVLRELDPDFDPLQLSASYIEKHLKEQEMSPEEKEAIERQQEYERIKAEHEELKKQLEEQQRAERMAKIEQELESDILGALDSDDELVADRDTIALVAENLLWAAKNGINDITAKDVLPTVKKQLRKQFETATSRFKSTAALKKYLGDDLAEKLREERLQQMKTKVNNVSNLKKNVSKKKEEKVVEEKIKLSSLF